MTKILHAMFPNAKPISGIVSAKEPDFCVTAPDNTVIVLPPCDQVWGQYSLPYRIVFDL